MSKTNDYDWKDPDPRQLVAEHLVAARWQRSIRTLQRWRSGNYGLAYIKIGGRIYYRASDVFAFEDLMRVTTGGQQ